MAKEAKAPSSARGPHQTCHTIRAFVLNKLHPRFYEIRRPSIESSPFKIGKGCLCGSDMFHFGVLLLLPPLTAPAPLLPLSESSIWASSIYYPYYYFAEVRDCAMFDSRC